MRLENAQKEIKECLESSKMIRFRVVNDDLEKATRKFTAIVEALYGEEFKEQELKDSPKVDL